MFACVSFFACVYLHYMCTSAHILSLSLYLLFIYIYIYIYIYLLCVCVYVHNMNTHIYNLNGMLIQNLKVFNPLYLAGNLIKQNNLLIFRLFVWVN